MIKGERGITIVELLVALAITALMIGTLVTAIYQIFDITGWGNAQLVVQHDLQNAATWLNRDVLTASRAEVSGSQMVLKVPDFAGTIVTRTITYTLAAGGTLILKSSDSSLVIARHVDSNPFPAAGVITAPNVITVTLHSSKGDVPGSGTFALKMRPGESILAQGLCQVTGAENLGFAGNTVSWVITNTGQTSPSIDEIHIAWPSANGGLNGIRLDTNLIWDGLQNPPSATINTWEPGSREIYSGTQKTLKFSFVSSAVSDKTKYSITITLTDKCTFPFPPNP